MNSVFRKRITRELKENFPRWTALFLMVAMGMYIVVSVVGAAENIIIGSRREAEKNLVEDGEFSTLFPLAEEQEKILEDAGIILERKFSLDIPQEDGSLIRLMKNRSEINLIELDEGRLAEKNGEIVLEKRYSEEHGYSVGKTIHLAGSEFAIVGIGSTSDYDLPVIRLSDMSAESALFGTAFVTSEQYDEFLAHDAMRTEDYTYAYRLEHGKTDGDVKREIKALALDRKSMENLTAFVTADKNPRILAAAGDMVMNKETGLIAGVVVMGLFAYVISVFVVNQINREAGVIGTLYALGAKKKDLLIHYITLPAFVTCFGGLSGAALGFSKIGFVRQMRETYAYFSVPVFDTIYPVYLVIYAAVMPPVLSVVVNTLVLDRRLSQTALSLIRNESRTSKLCNVKLKSDDFVHTFRIRHTLRELRASVTVIAGMFVSLLVLMLGLNCFVLCENVRIDSTDSVTFKYMYLLKYPEERIPDGAQACYTKSLSRTERGYTLDITVVGIGADDKYFNAKPSGGKNNLVIGKSVATKYDLVRGDNIILADSAGETDYVFTVEDVCDYSVGLTVFMDIDDMRELFGCENGYHNTLISDKPLVIDEGRIYSVTSRSDIERSASVFTKMLAPMVTMILSASVIIFFMVMYLMTGVMISRSGFGISLIKIFGFKTSEIRSLYLDGSAFTVAAGALACIPPAKIAIDALYPRVVANAACGLNLRFAWYFYPLIFAGIMLIYLVVIALQTLKINKITPAEVLKNRE